MSKKFQISGVGSLPHPHVDSALMYSFQHDIAFVPQLPLRDKKETMIYQGLDGIGKIVVENTGEVIIESISAKENWQSEISPSSYRCFRPFLYECEQRGITRAKVQLTGPFTLFKYSIHPRLDIDLFSWIQDFFIKRLHWIIENNPLEHLFIQIDEPALFMLEANQWHKDITPLFQKINSLKNESISIGVHCCSNCKWERLLENQLDFLSFDFYLSAERLLPAKNHLQKLQNLFIGILDTHPKNPINDQDTTQCQIDLNNFLQETGLPKKRVILTPGCGLGHKKIIEAQLYFEKLHSI
jgi:methionine synthase II (cobalamin-independent)